MAPQKPTAPELEPLAVRPEQAARLVGISRGRIYELIAAGELQSFKDGSARLIPMEALRTWVKWRGSLK